MRNFKSYNYSSIQNSPYKLHTTVSEREGEILNLLAEGQTVKEIASELYLSPHTIESHKKNLIRKFDAKNTVHLVVKFITNYKESRPALAMSV